MVGKLIGTHDLCWGEVLGKNVVLPHHVCIVFSSNQPITMSELTNIIVKVMVGWLQQDVVIGCLSKKTVHMHVMRKDHIPA